MLAPVDAQDHLGLGGPRRAVLEPIGPRCDRLGYGVQPLRRLRVIALPAMVAVAPILDDGDPAAGIHRGAWYLTP
jgi:hypothetical protein